MLFKPLLICLFLTTSTVSGVTFFCNHRWLFGQWQTFYVCNATLSNVHQSRTLTSVSGTHGVGQTNDDVNMVLIDGARNCANLDFVPQGMTAFYKNLISILILSCADIRVINSDDLTGYPRLQYFELTNSRLERIPGDYFRSNPGMRVINFNSNMITRVGYSLLDHLSNLERVSFNQNVCINASADRLTIIAFIEFLRNQCPDTPFN
jgi:Leucine rich repeat